VIRAAFHPRTAVVPQRLNETLPPIPLMMRAAAQHDLPMGETFLVLQTVRYDASGSGVWTLCIWKVGGENQVDKQWESAIVLSVI
jgi:hypothetical protein